MTAPPTPPRSGSPRWPQDRPPSPGSFFNRRRWMMLGLYLAVIVAVVLGLVVWNASDHGSGGPSSASDGDVDRTVGVLREKDPVCDEWGKYADELAEKEERWAGLNKGIPAAKWTPEQREIFESVGRAMSTAANRFESILPDARNVVLKELIAQTIVYLRAYVERIPSYVASDGLIAGVAGNFSNAVTYMCSAVPLVSAGDGPRLSSWVQEPSELKDFMKVRDPVCDKFVALADRQNAALIGWAAMDSTIAAGDWTPKQRTLYDAVRKTITRNLARFREIASDAEGSVMGDLIATQNAYVKEFADAIPSYAPDDRQLWAVATSLGGGLAAACEAQL